MKLQHTVVISCSVDLVIHSRKILLYGPWEAAIHGACCFVVAAFNK